MRLTEALLGALVLIGAMAALWFGLSQRPTTGAGGYELRAEFEDIEGIRAGSAVKIAGVQVGRVTDVRLNEFYFADVRMEIDADVTIPHESILTWKQSDFIGSPSLSVLVLFPDEAPMQPGDRFGDTDPANNIFELLSALASQSSTAAE